MEWQRARTEENKGFRKTSIAEAALNLFRENGYENVTFNGIAAEAGFTKSNMYRYFSSREEIFLGLFSDFFGEWVSDYRSRLSQLSSDVGVRRFVQTWMESFRKRTGFLDLMPFLFVSLEKNSSYEQLVDFKRSSKDRLYGISTEIARIYSELQGEAAFKFLNMSYALTSSYWAGSRETPQLKKIYKQEEFEMMKLDFETELPIALEAVVRGLRTKE